MRKRIKNIFSFLKYNFNRKKQKISFLKIRYIFLIFIFFISIEFLALTSFLEISLKDFFASILPDVLVDLTNIRREEVQVKELVSNELLFQAAQLKAQDMAEKGYFAHTSPQGITPWYWFNKVGYNYKYAGENLAVNFTDSYAVDRAWMESPTHRDNIINEKFEEIGIATAIGRYKEREAVFVVQLFGTKNEIIIRSELEEITVVLEPEETEKLVLGEETEKLTEEESFAFIEKVDDQPIYTIGNPEDILKQENPKYISLFEKISLKPLNYGIIIIGIFLLLIVFKISNIVSLLINGIIILTTIYLALTVNHYFLIQYIYQII
ncbi:MAG: CAP domain-containing protein [Candidatus Pacebacteria bacterium]|nr:CAP domain-containing protein [Candidatus Paceibacterota bacterium]